MEVSIKSLIRHSIDKPEFDIACETDRGCDPIPVTREMFGALQRTNARCKGSENVGAAGHEALKQLGEVFKTLTEKK